MYGVNIGVEFAIESLDDINYRHAFGCDAYAIFESSRCMVFQHGCVCFPTPGSLKRVVKVEDAIAVSIKQWRELPRKYFLSAWVKTGYFTMETLMAETNLTAEELETDPCHR